MNGVLRLGIRSRRVRDALGEPLVRLAEVGGQGADPTLDAKGDAAGEGVLAVLQADVATLAEEVPVLVERRDREVAAVHDLLLDGEDLRHQRAAGGGIEERVRRGRELDRQAETFGEAAD